jgi:hypothetical protein
MTVPHHPLPTAARLPCCLPDEAAVPGSSPLCRRSAVLRLETAGMAGSALLVVVNLHL